jgi:hypothetical protein
MLASKATMLLLLARCKHSSSFCTFGSDEGKKVLWHWPQVRYLYVFYLKNPHEFKDDFWHLFINLWVISVSFVSQFTFVQLPGKQPMNYYLCIGQVIIVSKLFWG